MPVSSKFTIPVFPIIGVVGCAGVWVVIQVKPPVCVCVCVCGKGGREREETNRPVELYQRQQKIPVPEGAKCTTSPSFVCVVCLLVAYVPSQAISLPINPSSHIHVHIPPTQIPTYRGKNVFSD